MKSKIPVAVLGATGSVGQKFIELLADHPWFEIHALGASERSAGKPYHEAVNWFMQRPIPQKIARMTVCDCHSAAVRQAAPEVKIAFSGLDSSVAGEIETEFAQAGIAVISNSRNHRMDEDVPLLIPEVNSDHLDLVPTQTTKGCIVTNPNCSTIGLVMALKPLYDAFGLEAVNVVTMQAISGAGYPGVPSLDILDNVIPYIGSEEEKMESEPLKILGTLEKKAPGEVAQSQSSTGENFQGAGQEVRIRNLDLPISASCNRVAVLDGHLECVSVKLREKVAPEELIMAWKSFTAQPQSLRLPSAPMQPIHYFQQENYPQPKLHRNLEAGMAVSVGRLRPCHIFDYKFVVLSHNTIRGAAGGAILNAELMLEKGLIK